MIIQLIYWKSLCSSCDRGSRGKKDFNEPSVEEIKAFKRTMQRHSGGKYLRYS